MADGGHTFVKKTFGKPTYCHHCSDLIWGIIQIGYICEVCNFVIHDRCVSSVVTPCSGIAPCIIKNPVAHCWSEPTHHKKKFCTVCRRRLDDSPAVHCLICEYFAHIECQDFAVPDCTENATYVPGKELQSVKHQHHWREGNLPPTSKCAYCKKTCWSSECLTGYRCEWCGMTTHGGCRMYLSTECNFGVLQPIYLSPHSVSIPRTEVPIEAIIGVQVKSKTALVRDYSCPDLRTIDCLAISSSANSMIAIECTERKEIKDANNTPELSLKEILFIERQRREKSKQNFLLSSSPRSITPSSLSPVATPTSPSPLSTLYPQLSHVSHSVRSSEHEDDDEQCKHVDTSLCHDFNEDSAIQMGSATTSSQIYYTNFLRRTRPISRKHLSSNTEDEEEDGGVCDVSGGEISDEYDNFEINSAESTFRKAGDRLVGKEVTRVTGGSSETGAKPGKEPRRDCFYETSDTGGEVTTTDDFDIDSSMNLISNLSFNSSNSNTSIENRYRLCDKHKNAQNVPLAVSAHETPPIIATETLVRHAPSTQKSGRGNVHEKFSKTGALLKAKTHNLNPFKGIPAKGGSISCSPNSSDCSSHSPTPADPLKVQSSAVGRSKSFQEPGVKQYAYQGTTARKKKYARLFRRRSKKRPSEPASTVSKTSKSAYSLDRGRQSIEITIQDEDGNYQAYDDDYFTLKDVRSGLRRRVCTDDDDEYEEEFDDDFVGHVETQPQLHMVHSSGASSPMTFHRYLDDRPFSGASDDAAGGDISDGGSSRSRSRNSDNEEHVFGRLLRRMQCLSLGWRKHRYYKRRARSISEEFSSGDTPRFKDEESVNKTDAMHASAVSGGSGTSSHYRPESTSHKSEKSDKDKTKKEKESEEKDIEMVKVFDGNNSFRRQLYRVISVPRTYTLEQLLTTALRAFHITRDPSAFYMTDLYAPSGKEDAPLQDPTPVMSLTHLEGKRPAIYIRFHDKDKGYVRVYPGKLQCSLEEPYVNVPVENTTIIKDLIRDALDRFGLQDNQIQDYRCSEVLLDRGVTERILSWNERPWDIMKQLGKDSIRQMELMRFYMQHKQDPHGPNIALFVGNLPPGLSQRNYEQILNKYVTDENKFTSIGPIYYEYGSVVLSFEDAQKAVRAFYNLRETIIEDKKLLVMLLPNIEPSMVPSDVRPLLVFVNVKSGGCQGLELISSFRKLLNPYQVFDLDNGGPLPGLYVFRQIANYKILVCGGDGTIGWVLQCLDNVGQDSECSSPPCAIVPLGTGNDLARVLCWGSGYTGGEDPLNLLRDVIEAEEIRLDRWTVVFHPEDKPEEPALKAPSNTTGGGAQNEDNSQIFVMNNYFGIGIDADLCLDFHNAREENPNKFNSRLHNKGYYVKMGLRKIVGRKTVKDLHKELKLEVDGKVVELPPVEGIIILNILSWGSGANPWGPDKDDNFSTPNHYDGVLEIVGVTGVVHLGQIQSGIRTAMRIAQGGHIKIHLYSDMPVQVDGEPWVQSPGDVVVLKSALKATMLKKSRGKRRLTEPHISPAVLASSLSASATASAAAAQGANQISISGGGGVGSGLGQAASAPENGDPDREAAIGT
ncbi:PREDICTED: diacylglycerol kinase theta isoform X2 [Rhagoletis zephyria]|uniref:diacylglycerol kinase theta isoform X2 n=1 Tax=Rhagoletis zephyria TaxID=28612 RepID=UPI00081128C6|nr:PREDICTED: diacylglycerol kinase theta isoform X2 [Rhagoletis zephyria]